MTNRSVGIVRLRDEPLARHSTFHAGGPADVVVVESGSALEAMALAGELPKIDLVLGGGSNVLVSDDGVAGTVLMLRSGGEVPDAAIRPDADGLVWLDGAWDWSAVASAVTGLGWQGLESMVGIPGTVGGAVVQSIGAYGYELREVVARVHAVDLASRVTVDLDAADIGFRYRDTDLKVQQPPRLVVTRLGLRLRHGGRHQPRYAELAARLAAVAGSRSDGYPPVEVAQVVLDLRRSKSMVYSPTCSQTWGAGSFFKNPELDEEAFGRLVDRVAVPPEAVPHWFIGGLVRVSAGWLVERSGYRRGHRDGDVALCANHALGVVNLTGRASAGAIADFAGRIRLAVYEHAGIVLHPEPVLVGLDLPDPQRREGGRGEGPLAPPPAKRRRTERETPGGP